MAYNPFRRRVPADAESTEFAATVAGLPPGVDLDPSEADPGPSDFLLMGPDSGILDTQPVPADTAVENSPTISHIGRYALKGPLGRGGLGYVHEAWDPLLSRTVAVKTLQFELGMADRVSLDALFLNEARAAAGLSHPNIVTIHDAGLSTRGVYIAMERLHGRDLRQALAEGWQPTPGQAATLVRRVADALAYAHARGVVHCDIKPGNIYLCQGGRPKVLDFGIARVAHSSALPLLDGLVAGSPHYLAPEQLQGGGVDARTDIHALGVVFYELLAGRKAYTGDTVEQIASAVLTNHPAPAHEVRAGVPPALAAIAARAMARIPEQRFDTAAAMATELRHWVGQQGAGGTPAEATRPAEAQPLEPPSRRIPRLASRRAQRTAPVQAAIGLAAALGVATLSVLLWWTTNAGPDEAIAASDGTATTAAMPAVPHPSAMVGAASAQSATAATNALAPDAAAADAGDSAASPAASPAGFPSARPAPTATGAASPKARPKTATTVVSATTSATPPAVGTLQLAISPWGAVEVNGNPAGAAPPLTRLSLPEGLHTITVRNEDFPPYTTTVQVQADRPVTVRHRFTP